jgi:uncharacterized membrane protein YkvA (DUF1232 family)
MSEIVDFLIRGASQVTPVTVERLLPKLPVLKAEFTQINAPKFPHLVDQLEFLADVVEDCAEGVYKELPYPALAEAVFALIYAHRQVDVIPDHLSPMGHADDSGVVRAVLIRHEKSFAHYAAQQGADWTVLTAQP